MANDSILSAVSKTGELKSRLLFVLGALVVYRLGAHIPVPGINADVLAKLFESQSGGILGMFNMFSGGALSRFTVFALGIMPYISASIIMQLLTVVSPQMEQLKKEGEAGRRQITKYTRYGTVLLATFQALGIAIALESQANLVLDPGFMFRLTAVVTLVSGTMFLMWLGEQITERGIGNGVSLLITVGILSRLPMAGKSLVSMFQQENSKFLHLVLLVLVLAIVVAGVVLITQGQRKIPVQYAQRAVGRKIMSGGTSFMPLRVNYAGVMPVIFAQAILMFPGMIFEKLAAILPAGFGKQVSIYIASHLGRQGFTYLFLYGLMILFFSYFWVATQFNELQVADDLKKHGGYIPGVRPGTATSDFLHNTMSRITLAGAVFLVVIAIIPTVMSAYLKIDPLVAQFFGGTSLLITVGVLLDTMRQMESYLLMRHYDGFLKKGKVRGRA